MGYCFHGSVGQRSFVPEKKSPMLIYFLTGLLLLIIAVLSFRQFYHPNSQSDLSQKEARRIYKIDSAMQAERLKKSQYKRK
jgi:hypothetical protein